MEQDTINNNRSPILKVNVSMEIVDKDYIVPLTI